jgi:hypothetical protein
MKFHLLLSSITTMMKFAAFLRAGSQAQPGVLESWHHGAIEVLQFFVIAEKAKNGSPAVAAGSRV